MPAGSTCDAVAEKKHWACYFLLNYARMTLSFSNLYSLPCYFLLNYATLHKGARGRVWSEDLLFSFELCRRRSWLWVFDEVDGSSLLFSFELCLFASAAVAEWLQADLLLFSFELCLRSSGLRTFNMLILPCYFLLNYAGKRNRRTLA